jgi:carboxypeptidase C (cathepsin A)
VRSSRTLIRLGPCRIEDKDGPQAFEYGWNKYANILFVDQPIGVGFSYSDHGETVVGKTSDISACR